MPAFNAPGDDYLMDRLGQNFGDVAALKKQSTEYVVNPERLCVAIIGNMENYPTAAGGSASTGLTGWGIAVLKKGVWVSLNE